MKKISLSVLFAVFVLFARVEISAQDFPYEVYKTRAIAELIDVNSDAVSKMDYKNRSFLINAAPYYSAIRLKYAGRSRPISEEKRKFLKIWQETLQVDEKIYSLLENEYLFKECDKEHWIIVQKQVAAYFPKELKENDYVTLYLMSVGGAKTTDKWEFIFLTNEFIK